MYGKEKEFTSFDSQGPTDFDIVGFHLDTIEDIFKLIEICQNEPVTSTTNGLPITSEKLDELRHYTEKLKEYIKN